MEWQLPYLAGFIDGEGSIAIGLNQSPATKKHPKRRRWYLRMSCHQLNPDPLHLLKDQFGGSIRQHGYSKDKLGKRRLFEWVTTAEEAAKAIETLRPYLIVKADEADLAIAFQNTVRNRAIPGWRPPLTQEEQDQRQSYYLAMRELKQRKYGIDVEKGQLNV